MTDQEKSAFEELIQDAKRQDRPWLTDEGWARLNLKENAYSCALKYLLQLDLLPYTQFCYAHGTNIKNAERAEQVKHGKFEWRKPIFCEKTPSRKEFCCLERKNYPVVVRDCTKNWKAMHNWTFESLQDRYPDSFFRISDTHGAVLTMEEFIKYMHTNSDDCPFGVYDSQFGFDERQDMTSDYDVPACFNHDLFQKCKERPPFRWILLGPCRSGTAMHVDPLLTHAWVTLIKGQNMCSFLSRF